MSPLHARSGFSLLELAIALVATGLVAALALSVQRSGGTSCYETTKHQLSTIEQALDQFVHKNERLPLPALRTAGVEDVAYGREASLSALTNVSGVAFGALPFQSLGLSPSYAGDCWSNKYTYAVTTALTTNAASGGYPDPNANGAIHIKSNATNILLNDAAWAVISHGANGNGAVKVNYRDPSNNEPKWCSAGGASPSIDTMNCGASSSTLVAAEFNDGKDGAANLFDDVVIFKGKLTRVVNGICSATPNTCLAGTAINFVAGPCSSTDSWTCKGVAGGTNAACSAANAACPPPPPPAPPPPSPSPSPDPDPGPTPGPWVPPPSPVPGPWVPPPTPTPEPPTPTPTPEPPTPTPEPPTPTPDPCPGLDQCGRPVCLPLCACITAEPCEPTPEPTPDPGPCCQPYWDLGFQCPDYCFETPPPSKGV